MWLESSNDKLLSRQNRVGWGFTMCRLSEVGSTVDVYVHLQIQIYPGEIILAVLLFLKRVYVYVSSLLDSISFWMTSKINKGFLAVELGYVEVNC